MVSPERPSTGRTGRRGRRASGSSARPTRVGEREEPVGSAPRRVRDVGGTADVLRERAVRPGSGRERSRHDLRSRPVRGFPFREPVGPVRAGGRARPGARADRQGRDVGARRTARGERRPIGASARGGREAGPSARVPDARDEPSDVASRDRDARSGLGGRCTEPYGMVRSGRTPGGSSGRWRRTVNGGPARSPPAPVRDRETGNPRSKGGEGPPARPRRGAVSFGRCRVGPSGWCDGKMAGPPIYGGTGEVVKRFGRTGFAYRRRAATAGAGGTGAPVAAAPFRCIRGDTQRSPQTRSSRVTGASPSPISVSE